MSNINIPQAINTALQHHRAGELPKAEAIYRRVLQVKPDHPDALHLLGLIANQIGNHEAALNLISKAIAVNAKVADFHNSRGEVYRAMGRLDEAIASYERAMQLRPGFVEPCYNQGLALQDQGRLEAAVVRYEKALALRPDLSMAHNNLGNIRQQQGRLMEAIRHYEQALASAPDNAEAHSNLGNVLQTQGRMADAIACYHRALAIRPGYAGALHNLGNALRELGKLDESVQCYRQALLHEPDYAEAHNSLGNVLGELGNSSEAMASYRQAIALNTDSAEAFSNLLLTQNYVCDLDAESIFSEHLEFSRRYAEPLAALVRPHTNDRAAGRRLRIGYVSGDFKNHAVAYFIEPILAQHDRAEYEVFCYSNHGMADEVTRRLQSYVDHWRVVAQLPDDNVAQRIREDGIDILVDLSGHTRDNRLLVFARKPAPVQVTWLGYLNTTGISTMDYRLADRFACPPGMMDNYHTEEVVRLPDSQWCYQPPREYPEVGDLPALESGGLTFASFHNIAKISPAVLGLWARLLDAIQGSRLLLVGRGVDQKAESWGAHFAEHGIDPLRLEFLGGQSFDRYLALHQRVDVNLDAFPYPGGTTTCHSLWMGVPLITLAGSTVISRGGASLLTNLGLSELVAESEEEYIGIAVRLATDIERLKALRAGLRERMSQSPLMDAERFTRHLESAYRRMWQRWCESGS